VNKKWQRISFDGGGEMNRYIFEILYFFGFFVLWFFFGIFFFVLFFFAE